MKRIISLKEIDELIWRVPIINAEISKCPFCQVKLSKEQQNYYLYTKKASKGRSTFVYGMKCKSCNNFFVSLSDIDKEKKLHHEYNFHTINVEKFNDAEKLYNKSHQLYIYELKHKDIAVSLEFKEKGAWFDDLYSHFSSCCGIGYDWEYFNTKKYSNDVQNIYRRLIFCVANAWDVYFLDKLVSEIKIILLKFGNPDYVIKTEITSKDLDFISKRCLFNYSSEKKYFNYLEFKKLFRKFICIKLEGYLFSFDETTRCKHLELIDKKRMKDSTAISQIFRWVREYLKEIYKEEPIDVFIVKNLPKCERTHKESVSSVFKNVRIVRDLSLARIQFSYCEKCERYYILDSRLNNYFDRLGALLINIVTEEVDTDRTSRGVISWKKESLLKRYGYSVGKDSLSSIERKRLLVKLIEFKIFTLNEVISHIEWVKKVHDKDVNACLEWNSDLEFLYNYNINTQKEVYNKLLFINRIRRNYKDYEPQ